MGFSHGAGESTLPFYLKIFDSVLSDTDETRKRIDILLFTSG